MGWSTYHREPGQTDREHFTSQLDDTQQILECATIKSVFYAAVLDKRDGKVWGAVCLMQRNLSGDYNFGVKEMSDTVGPCYYDCPDRILDLLTPTESEYANEWRKTCREANAKRSEVKDGTVIRLASALKFQGGHEAQEFRLRVSGRTRRWIANPGTDHQFMCRLPRDWATRYAWERKEA